MDPQTDVAACPVCHTQVRQTDYFCFNCGKNLRERPPDTGAARQTVVYLVSFLLPPMGVVYGIRYGRWADARCRTVAAVSVLLTLLSAAAATILTIRTVSAVNAAVESQMQQFGGF